MITVVQDVSDTAAKEMSDLGSSIQATAKNATRDALKKIGNSLPSTPEYGPPQYVSSSGKNATEAQTDFETQTGTFETQSKHNVGLLANASVIVSGSVEPVTNGTVKGPSLNITVSSLKDLLSFFESPWVAFSDKGGELGSTDVWIAVFNTVISSIATFDILWRCWRTCAYFYRFWACSIVYLEPVDMLCEGKSSVGQLGFCASVSRLLSMQTRPGQSSGSKKGKSGSGNTNAYKSMLMLVTSPAFGGALALFFVTYLTYMFAVVYGPVFQHYRDGCVVQTYNETTQQSEYKGTYWSEQLYSIGYNYASRDGSQHALTELNTYNEQRATYCTGGAGESQTLYATQQQQHDAFARDVWPDAYASNSDPALLPSAAYQVFLMHNTLDLTNTTAWGDTVFQSTMTNLLNTYTSAPHDCSAVTADTYIPNTYLEVAEWGCDALPKCDTLATECPGPIREDMAFQTRGCSCTVEWWVHSGVLTFILALAIYICGNISRLLLVRGICRLQWHDIHDGYYQYTGSCDEHGKRIEPAYMTLQYRGKSRFDRQKQARKHDLMVKMALYSNSGKVTQ